MFQKENIAGSEKQQAEELNKQKARDMLAPLLENHMMLPRDIFDYKDEMHHDVAAHIKRCLPFIKNELISFIKDPLEDIVCLGPICGSVHSSRTPVRIAFVLKTEMPDQILKNISDSLIRRGFRFKIYDHPLFFEVCRKDDILGASWSLIHQKWIKKPEIQAFSYSLDDLLEAYMGLNNDFHQTLDHLPKNKLGLYTPESCSVIKAYFQNIDDQAKDAIKNNPAHEYALICNLSRCLNVFRVREYFMREVARSEAYYISGGADGQI